MKRTLDRSARARQRATRVLAGLLLGGGLLIAASACNTTQGAGKDLKSLGGGIEDSAAKNK